MFNENFFIPKVAKKKTKIIKCTHPGCCESFEAYPHTRFCEYHKNPDTRPVAVKVEESCMFVLEHDFQDKQSIERNCDCCGHPYRLNIYPGGKLYPRFCENHRSEFRRTFWREQHNKQVR